MTAHWSSPWGTSLGNQGMTPANISDTDMDAVAWGFVSLKAADNQRADSHMSRQCLQTPKARKS